MRTDQLSPSEKSTLKMRHSPPSIYRSFKTGTSPSGRKAEMVAGMFSGWKVCIRFGDIVEREQLGERESRGVIFRQALTELNYTVPLSEPIKTKSYDSTTH
jgi:hypothetical protein